MWRLLDAAVAGALAFYLGQLIPDDSSIDWSERQFQTDRVVGIVRSVRTRYTIFSAAFTFLAMAVAHWCPCSLAVRRSILRLWRPPRARSTELPQDVPSTATPQKQMPALGNAPGSELTSEATRPVHLETLQHAREPAQQVAERRDGIAGLANDSTATQLQDNADRIRSLERELEMKRTEIETIRVEHQLQLAALRDRVSSLEHECEAGGETARLLALDVEAKSRQVHHLEGQRTADGQVVAHQALQVSKLLERRASLTSTLSTMWTRHAKSKLDYRPRRFLRVISPSDAASRTRHYLKASRGMVFIAEAYGTRDSFTYGIFDHVFGEQCDNEDINLAMKGFVAHVLRGWKSLIFLDGYSGSGKTSTLLWSRDGQRTIAQYAGLALLQEFGVLYIEVCQVTDRLEDVPTMAPEHLAKFKVKLLQGRPREIPCGRYEIGDAQGLEAVLRHIDGARKKAATSQNDTSSRSHVSVVMYGSGAGRLHMVDVCGGEVAEEGSDMINAGRTALRTYVSQCSDPQILVPVKDHALTRVIEKVLLPMSSWTQEKSLTLPKTALISHVNLHHPWSSAQNVCEFATGKKGELVYLPTGGEQVQHRAESPPGSEQVPSRGECSRQVSDCAAPPLAARSSHPAILLQRSPSTLRESATNATKPSSKPPAALPPSKIPSYARGTTSRPLQGLSANDVTGRRQ